MNGEDGAIAGPSAVGGAERAVLVGRQVVLSAEGCGLETQPDLPVAILEQSGALAKHPPGVRVPTESIEGLAEREERIGALSVHEYGARPA